MRHQPTKLRPHPLDEHLVIDRVALHEVTQQRGRAVGAMQRIARNRAERTPRERRRVYHRVADADAGAAPRAAIGIRST